jgi:PST family polysaccharide transporter
MKNKEARVIKNTLYLYILTFAKLIFPILTLPYLTRVLNTDTYGAVSYVKTFVSYVQIIIDFGFLWSATKEVTESLSEGNKGSINKIIGDTVMAKGLLGLLCLVVMSVFCCFVPLLRENVLFTFLYVTSVLFSVFIPEFFFRGIEKMEYVSIRYVLSKALSTFLTLMLVKSDANILLIPVLEIASTLISIAISLFYMKKLGYSMEVSSVKKAAEKIKTSFVYFISTFATTAFGALNTVLVGIFMTPSDVAYWSVCSVVVTAVQSMYNPLLNSLYPHMIKNKSRKLLAKTMLLFMPIVTLGCVIAFIWSEPILILICGEEYSVAASLFRYLIPLLFISFPAQLYGWPALGAIDKAKEISASTVIAALVQIAGLLILILIERFTFINLAVVRFISESSMLLIRYIYYRKYKHLYDQGE